MTRLVPTVILTAAAVGTTGAWPQPTPVESLVPVGAAASRAATVSGRVDVAGRERDAPSSLSPYARRRYRPPQHAGPAEPEDAVVYFEALSASPSSTRAGTATISQRDRTIHPHVLAVQAGTEVDFPNEDDVFHNLFSFSSGNRFSLGRYGPGVTKTHRFSQPGVVRLFCDIHAEMAGVILVVDTPWVARPDHNGAYRLSGLPAGQYRVIAWHPTAGADSVTVTLRDGEEEELNFSLRPAS